MASWNDEISALKSLLDTPQDIVITTHKDPDGDALGSSLGLMHALRKERHNVHVVLPSGYPDQFNWLPEVEALLTPDLDGEESEERMKKATLVFYLDFNGIDRVERYAQQFTALDVPKVMIDHHIDPEPIADVIFSDTTASSTCELVYEVLESTYGTSMIDETVASCLYTGIVTDTGSFKYAVRPALFITVSKLLETGIDSNKLQDHIFNSESEKYLRLLGHCITNRMELLHEYGVGIFYLTKSDYTNFDIQRGDTEGIINYLLKIKKIKMAIFFKQQHNIIKVSLRSKGDLNVQQIARELFNGGGHFNASGGYMHSGLHKAMNLFKDSLPNYLATTNH